MTDQALDMLMRRVLINALRKEEESVIEVMESFSPSRRHQRQMEEMLKDPLKWMRKKTRPVWKTIAQKVAVILLVASIGLAGLVAVSPTVQATVIRRITEWIDSNVEILTEENRFLIGKEMFNPNITVSSGDEWDEQIGELEDETMHMASVIIPDNPIIHSVANENCVPGSSIQEITSSKNRTPEIIVPNGAMAVFSVGNAEGWTCGSGDTIIWRFEKYPMESGASQTLGVGYVKDGVMHEMQVFRDSLNGEYKLSVHEQGVYHIYVIGLSSDPISIKESKIEIG